MGGGEGAGAIGLIDGSAQILALGETDGERGVEAVTGAGDVEGLHASRRDGLDSACGYDKRPFFAAGHDDGFDAKLEQAPGEVFRRRGIVGGQAEEDSGLTFVGRQHVHMGEGIRLQSLGRGQGSV